MIAQSHPNALSPDQMTPDARIAELGRIVAAGVLRLAQPRITGLSAGPATSKVP